MFALHQFLVSAMNAPISTVAHDPGHRARDMEEALDDHCLQLRFSLDLLRQQWVTPVLILETAPMVVIPVSLMLGAVRLRAAAAVMLSAPPAVILNTPPAVMLIVAPAVKLMESPALVETC